MNSRKIIVDCDVGTDDAWALFLLIRNEKVHNIKVIAITCTYGNGPILSIGRNILMILKSINRLDIPVYIGCHEAIVHNFDKVEYSFHGPDGLGGLNQYYIDVDMTLISKEHAVPALARILSENTDVTILCIGPLTNIGLVVKIYPETIKQINSIYIMGGSYNAVGNITDSAEFNFYQDPEAVDIILKIKTFPIFILPWEACLNLNMTLEWRLNFINDPKMNKSNHMLLKLLDPIEKTIYENHNSEYWIPCDAIVAAVLIDKDVACKIKNINVLIELAGNMTRGQLVLRHMLNSESNVHIIEQVNVQIFTKLIEETLTSSE